jgi:hypothetical protein
MPQLLYLQGKSPCYPVDRRLGGPQSQYGYGGEEKNSQPLPGLKCLTIQPVAYYCTTELYWLQKCLYKLSFSSEGFFSSSSEIFSFLLFRITYLAICLTRKFIHSFNLF